MNESSLAEAPAGITVMTINVGNGLAPDVQVLRALRESDADIIGIEELNRRQARVLEEGLADAYPFSAFFGDSYEGRGLLSRFPLMSANLVHFIPDRPDVLATIDTGPLLLTVIVGHPRPQIMRRGRVMFQTASLRQILGLARLAQQQPPAVLMGDFNMSPRHPGYGRFRKLGLTDAFAVAGSGRGLTFPLRLGVVGIGSGRERRRKIPVIPVKRFDHIWHTPDLVAERAWIGPDAGSDHASVMARILLPGAGR
ncbi:MAG: endonuclease/exonuclease/phosphatase family protein [Chloroflexota bacterium]|nr:endonuclease/exonuclease/phosphatase family protein [Chloroflexota bacterium]